MADLTFNSLKYNMEKESFYLAALLPKQMRYQAAPIADLNPFIALDACKTQALETNKKTSRYPVYKARRDKWIAQNGPCRHCGNNKNLQVDHIIPRKIQTAKKAAAIWKLSDSRRKAELKLCQVLCGECHKRKTAADLNWGRHGLSRYRRGCRCKECTEAQRLAHIKFRKKRAARG